VSCSYPVDTFEKAGESCAELRDGRSYLHCFSVRFFLEKSKLRQLEVFGPTGPVSIGFDTVASILFRIRCQPLSVDLEGVLPNVCVWPCRVAVTGAPVQGLKMCPGELCPTIGRALIGLGAAVMRPGQLLTVYRLCPQQW